MATLDIRSGSNDRGLVASDNNHTTVINATSANAAVEGSGDDFASDEFFTPTYFLRRSVIEFDLTQARTDSIAESGTIEIVFAGVTGDTDGFSVNIFHFNRASTPNTAFVANDYDEAVGVAACDSAKDITGLTGTQSFTLNTAAIAYLQSKIGGYAQFSARVSGDYGPSTPTGANLINGYRGTDGTESNRPRLQLVYRVPSSRRMLMGVGG